MTWKLTVFKTTRPFIPALPNGASWLFHVNRKGFTLLELALVMFLIGLVLSISMPRLGNFIFHTDLKSISRSLKSVVYVMRSKSISTNTYTILHFDLDQNLYWGTAAAKTKQPSDTPEETPVVSPVKLPPGIRFVDAGNINSVKKTFGVLSSAFNPKGMFEETVLHMADRDENVMTIIINAFTGSFMIYDEYVDVEYGKE
jgi:prepilin-type N-terminal cleavage/methylation domain-containing protein